MAGTIITTEAFETLNWKDAYYAESAVAGEISRSNAVSARNGSYAGRFELNKLDADVAGSRRSEVTMKFVGTNAGWDSSYGPNNMGDFWFAFSVYLPPAYVYDQSGESLFQVKTGTGGTSLDGFSMANPPLALLTSKGRWVLNNKFNATMSSYDLGAYQTGVWTDIVIHYKMSWGSDGLLQVWKDGAKVHEHAGQNYFQTTDGFFQKIGIYKWDWKEGNPSDTTQRIAYFDEFKIGASDCVYADVAPQPLRAVSGSVSSTATNVNVQFSTSGTKTGVLRVTARGVTVEKAVTVVVKPEPATIYTPQQISTMILADGGRVDSAILNSYITSLPDSLRANATVIGMLPTATRTGKFYSFDNKNGKIIAHDFVRGTQATGMNQDDSLWLYQIDEPVFEYTSGYAAQKQAVIDSILANAARKYVVDYLPGGYVTDGTVNYGSQFNTALDAGLDVIMPDFPLMVNNGSYSANDGQRILFQANSELRIQTGLNSVDYNILDLRGKSNITLINPKVRGDRGHGGTSPLAYERGQGITLSGCVNAVVYDPLVYDCQGDGIYFAYYGRDCQNITIYNPILHHNGRNNLSITNGIGINLIDGIFAWADKSNPVSGIDIEPNAPTVGTSKRLTDFRIINPITSHNYWSGIQISTSQRYSATAGDAVQPFNCYIQNHRTNAEVFAHRITMDKSTGDITGQFGKLTFLNPDLNNAVAYSAPPGGGSATTNPPFDDGNKVLMKEFIDDPGMTLEYLHPKINVNGVQYTNAQLTDFCVNKIINQRTTKVIIVP